MVTGNGYRSVLALPSWWPWASTALLSRCPVAMAPLALVLLGHATYGSFAVGGVLSAAHALAEALAGPVLGARLDRRADHHELRAALAAQAGLYVALAAIAGAVPLPVTIVLTAASGAAGAGVSGGLRAVLVAVCPPDALRRALSVDTILLELAWTLGPLLVAAAVAVRGAAGAVVAMGACSALALACSAGLPDRPAEVAGRSPLRALRKARWTLAFALVGGVAGGTLDTALPPKLAAVHVSPSLAGPLFAAYSVASMVGGLLYGHRKWPGHPRRQASVLLLALVVALMPAAFAGDPVTAGIAVTVAGFFAAPQLAARALALEQDVPPGSHAAGFAALNTTNGAGYGLAGLAVGGLLGFGPAAAFAIPLGACGACLLGGRLVPRGR